VSDPHAAIDRDFDGHLERIRGFLRIPTGALAVPPRVDRILFVNGHGSNQPLVDIAARLIGVERREAVCGSCF
jgi:hypothetical protein